MRFLFLTGFIVFASFFSIEKAFATHSMGADLTYTCMGGNTYKLRLTFYRDCFGIAAPIQPYVSINSASCGQDLTVYLDAILGTGQEITPICPSALSTCNGGSFTGIEEWIYEGTVVLPAQCTDWDFSYDLCCRNQAITTINNPTGEDLYIHSTLNNTISPCNNSPTFSNKPVPFVCLGQQFCFNHGASDADGDSLVYSLMTPLGGIGTGVPVTYFTPYSATQPLNSAPPMTFDPLTGDFCATPQQIEVTVMAVLVREYRNGVLIGQVERDMQITVIPCSNLLPNLSGINGTGNFTETICADEPFCFNIFSNDPDAGQNVSLSWDNAIANATFSVSGSPFPTGNFCWTPTQADVSAAAHCFTVHVWDDACPYYGSQVYSYCLTVVNLSVDAGTDQSVSCTNTATIAATTGGIPGSYTYLWSNGATTASQSVGTGVYTVTVSNGLCTATDEVTISPLAGPVAAFGINTSCTTLAGFTDQSSISTGSITGWNWNFGDGNTSAQQNPNHQFVSPGTYNVCLIVSSDVGCSDTICQNIMVSDPPVANFSAGNVCEGVAITISNTSTPAGGISYDWDFGNGTTSILQNPSVLYSGASAYTITLVITDTIGCTDTLVQPVTVYPLPTAAFSIVYDSCQSSQVSFIDNSTGSINTWNWDFGDGQTSTQQSPGNQYNPGTYNICLAVTSADGCIDSIIQGQNIIPPIVVSAGPSPGICEGEQANISASGGILYQWSDGQSGNSINVSPSLTTTYTVTVTDNSGCSDTTSVLVIVNPLPQLIVTPGTSICEGESITLDVSGANNYLWSTGETTGTITVTPVSSVSLSVTGIDNNGCSDTAFTNVAVNNLPFVSLSDISFCSGETGVLDINQPGMTYLWNSGETTQSISVTQAGIYSITVTDINGCSDTAQAVVAVDPLPILVISPDEELCSGESVTLSVSGANSYVWTTGETTDSIIVNPASSGSYSVTGTDNNGCSSTALVNVTVNVPPVVSLQDISFCSGETELLDAGIAGMSYLWNNGETAQQISVSQPGTYIITVTDGNGCLDTAQALAIENPLPQLITSPDQVICEGDATTLSVSGADNYVWSTGDVSASINVTPPSSTNYSVTGTDTNGCEITVFINVIVNSLPVVTLTDASMCPGDSTVLDAGLSGMSYVWNTGQTTQDISITQNGSYTVTVTDGNGCTDSDQATISLYPLPQVSAGPDLDICNGESISLTATGGVSYLWNTGDSTTVINITPVSNISYSVVSTDANGCSDTASVYVTIHNLPVLNIPNSIVCPGSVTTLNAGHPNMTFLWNTGHTTQTISVSQPGMYTVTVTSSWGCSSSQSVQVTPGGGISNNSNIVSFCAGDSAVLDAGNPGNTYLWTPGGATTQSIIVYAAGAYSVVITNPNGCSGIVNSTVSVNPLPVTGFTAIGGCAGQPVNFSDTTNLSSGSISQWLWDFGDGNSSLLQNPVHAYSASGLYSVSLTVLSDSGCTDSFSQNINTAALPVADFTSSGLCPLTPATFNDASSGGSINSWNWNFGDGTSSILQNPLHAYSLPGTYLVTLNVTTVNGCSNSKTKQVTIHSLPDADFSSAAVCRGSNTPFTDLSSDSSGILNSWQWNFGDGTVSTQANPSHLYSQDGNYTVQLIVATSNGCFDTVAHNITVHALPNANAGPDQSICQGQPVMLNASGGTSYMWSTGQTFPSISVNPTATTSYILTVTNSNGCKNTDTVMVGVGSAPFVNLTDAFICAGNSVALNAGNQGSNFLWSTGETTQNISVSTAGNYSVTVTNNAGCTGSADATITVGGSGLSDNLNDVSVCPDQSVVFDAGNSGSVFLWTTGSTSQSITVYTPGIYSVTVTDTSGCAATFSALLTIDPLPVAGFSATHACLSSQTIFSNTSTIISGTISSYDWDFRDGDNSQIQNPVHTYTAQGNFNVSLTVTSDAGCIDSIILPVSVYASPVASFSAADACLYDAVVFSDNSSVSNDTITSWLWDFGDATSSVNQNTFHNYNDDGAFPVWLIVTTGNGCSDSVSQIVNIHPVPHAAFNGNPVCENLPVNFTDTSTINTGIISGWTWNFGDNTTSSLQSPSHNYPGYGLYSVSLITTSGLGCSDTATENITVFPLPTADFNSAPECLGNATSFNNQSSVPYGTIFSLWNFGDGNSSSVTSPSHIYQGNGTFNATLTITTNNGCTASISQPAVVYAPPISDFNVNDVCLGLPAVFADQSSCSSGNINSWFWNFGDGTNDTIQHPQHIYSSHGAYLVLLEVISTYGCSNIFQDTINIFMLPQPQIQVSNGCITGPVTFTDVSDTALTGTSAWLWNFGDGFTSTDPNPVHLYQFAGLYNVMLTAYTLNGCESATTEQLEIYPVPVTGFTNDNACAGSPVQFANTSMISNGNIDSYQWFFGDSTFSTETNPSHVYVDAGVYTVMLIAMSNYGCTDTAWSQVTIFHNPVTNFSFDLPSGCGPLTIRFSDSSYVVNSTIVAWDWDFGDGYTDTVQNPVHVYTDAGIYPVTLSTVSAHGCKNTLTIQNAIEIYPDPIANFIADPYITTILEPVYFTNQSSGAVTYLWDFGDAAFSELEHPYHLYNDTGNYVISLVAINQYGCTDTSLNEVVMTPTYTAYIPNAFTPNDDDKNEIFTISGIGIKHYEMFIWNRWGGLVYNGVNEGWNGRMHNNGEIVKQDVYIYRIVFRDIFNDLHKWQGRVSVIK